MTTHPNSGLVLETPRLRLRELAVGDLAALHDVLGDPIAMAAYEHGFSLAESAEWIDHQRRRYAEDGFGLWAVELVGGPVIGDCGLTRQPLEDDEVVEVGYHLRRRYQGRGYAVEAARAACGWGFTALPVDAIWAKVRTSNAASMNVAIRLGMTVHRTFTTRYRGVNMPHLGFRVTRTEFECRDSEMSRKEGG